MEEIEFGDLTKLRLIEKARNSGEAGAVVAKSAAAGIKSQAAQNVAAYLMNEGYVEPVGIEAQLLEMAKA